MGAVDRVDVHIDIDPSLNERACRDGVVGYGRPQPEARQPVFTVKRLTNVCKRGPLEKPCTSTGDGRGQGRRDEFLDLLVPCLLWVGLGTVYPYAGEPPLR